MNLERFTNRSQGMVQAAQLLCMREEQQSVSPAHLAKVLLDEVYEIVGRFEYDRDDLHLTEN